MSELNLSERYGQKPLRWRSTAIVLLILGGGWLIWAGLHHSRPPITTTLISFEIPSDRAIDIRYSIDRRTPTDAVTCTLVAYDIDKKIVGEIQDQSAGGAARLEKVTQIPTRAAPVSAAISRCRSSSQ